MPLEQPRVFGSSQRNPLLSIIVPVGPISERMENIEKWIPECPPEFELILIVDEYGDSTFDLLSKFLESKPNEAQITLLRGKFGGPGLARNAGLEISRGAWIVFWDSDDLPNVKAVSRILSKVNGNEDVIVCGYEVVNRGLKSSHVTKSLAKLAYNPGIWRILINQKSIQSSSFPDIRLGEDQVFLSKLIDNSKHIIFEDSCIYSYFTSQTGQLTSGTKNALHLLEAANLIKNSNKKGRFHRILEFRLRSAFIKRCIKGKDLSLIEFDWVRYVGIVLLLMISVGKSDE